MTIVENHLQERANVHLPATLRGQETNNDNWEETGTIYNLTRNSVGLILNREYAIGRLLSLSAPIPIEMRCLNQDEEDYAVWGIVQHCTAMLGDNHSGKYYLGIALIGEKPPASYLANPLQSYRLCGIQKDGLWRIEEAKKEFITRKYPRFNYSIEIYLGQLDEQSNMSKGEKVSTENISVGGVALFSGLDLTIGDCVKVIAAEYEFSALAVVRNITSKNNQKSKICLEFVAGKFPVERLKTLEKRLPQNF